MKKLIYLDTSIAERFFKKAILSEKQNKPFSLPKIFSYFKNHREIQLFTSSFTLAEIYEHLWKGYQSTSVKIAKLTNIFLYEFRIIPILEFTINPEILRWIRKYKLEAKDIIHLSIAKNKDFILLTDDEDLLNKGKIIYSKIISEEDLPFLTISNHFSDNRSHHLPSFFVTKRGADGH